jgi:hypothetical protein
MVPASSDSEVGIGGRGGKVVQGESVAVVVVVVVVVVVESSGGVPQQRHLMQGI